MLLKPISVASFPPLRLQKLNLENIIGSNGNKFKPQASAIKDVYSKEDGYLSAGKEFSGFYKML